MEAGQQLDNHTPEDKTGKSGNKVGGQNKIQDNSGRNELLVKQLIAAVTDMNNALLLFQEEKEVGAIVTITTRLEKIKFMFKDFAEKDTEFGDLVSRCAREMDTLWRETAKASANNIKIRLDGDYIG